MKPGPADSGILARRTVADRGLVEVPLLAPHLAFYVLDDYNVILRSETFETALHGNCYPDLLPHLDGGRSRREIVALLAAKHPAIDVQTALVSLAFSGYAVSAEFAMKRETAAFWSALGASPRWAEERLAAARIAITGDSGRLGVRLRKMGLRPTADAPTVSVLVCADYLEAEHAAVNRRHLASGLPWMLLQPFGLPSLFGPVFRPGDGGPCWECMAFRLRTTREVASFVRRVGADPALPVVDGAAFTDAVHGLAAAEIAKWVVLGDLSPVHEHAVSFDASWLETAQHAIGRRPQCRACGDQSLFRPDRSPAPVRLRPSPKPVRNSGGLRSVSPERTLADYRHLVSPVGGIVTRLQRISDAADPWLHVHMAGNNPILKARSLGSLLDGVRLPSAGKGSTPQQSEASALCETIEGFSGMFMGDEIRLTRRFSDFVAAGADDAIHPNEVQLFSDRQFDRAEQSHSGAVGTSPAFRVPARFDPDAAVSWSPVWSLTQGRHRFLPTSLLYFGGPAEREDASYCLANSNGCAAGNTLEEAILQGFLELAERDSVAIWWYNRLRRPEVDMDSFGDEYLAQARARYGAWQRELWMLDLTGDLGIPVFVAVSRRTDGEDERILYGFGAHTDPRIAALRAVCELNQMLPAFHARDPELDNAPLGEWLRDARIAGHCHLAPDPGAAVRGRTDHPVPDTEDVRDDIEYCRALIEKEGLEFLVLDQTRPDIGMPVARTIVPGMRHFLQRFAPGRLYDVPVEMGWCDSPVAEADLNPFVVGA